jgi:hypothetical protein
MTTENATLRPSPRKRGPSTFFSSFQGARQPVRAKRGPMTGSASEPGIQKLSRCARLDSGSGAARRPGMTKRFSPPHPEEPAEALAKAGISKDAAAPCDTFIYPPFARSTNIRRGTSHLGFFEVISWRRNLAPCLFTRSCPSDKKYRIKVFSKRGKHFSSC